MNPWRIIGWAIVVGIAVVVAVSALAGWALWHTVSGAARSGAQIERSVADPVSDTTPAFGVGRYVCEAIDGAWTFRSAVPCDRVAP